ncbi:MAG: hypothetical protein IPO21_07685 [Bacteroidales bacterium]|nr:hypothetical protein [Bacteroidales bacterium]
MESKKSTPIETSSSLQISPKGQKKLTKQQVQFNNLIKKVARLETEIEKGIEKANANLIVYSKNISPLENEIALNKIQLATEIDAAFYKYKFPKKHNYDFELVITTLLDEAFEYTIPSKEQEALYDRWAKTPYREELNNCIEDEKEMTAEFLKNMFGIDIDLSKYDDSPESQAQLHLDLKELRDNMNQEKKHSFSSNSKKQQEKELAQKADEELKNRNIRSIYIILAKILYLDSETDEEQKFEKQELMKKVTVAYDQKDLPTLLKLELEWVHKTTEHLDSLTDDKLKTYISALKEQVKELEIEKANISYNPRFRPIIRFFDLEDNYFIKEIKRLKKDLKAQSEEFNMLVKSVRNAENKNQTLPVISQLAEFYEVNDLDSIFDDFDFDFYDPENLFFDDIFENKSSSNSKQNKGKKKK